MSTESVWLTHLPLVLGWVRPLPPWHHDNDAC